MARKFLGDAATTALRDAISSIEARSSAELVVSVRARSAAYLHADILVGVVAALGALAFLLFSPWPFALHWFLIDPILVGGVCALAASRLPPIRRALTPRAERDGRVRAAAGAIFLEKGVHHTRGRTGQAGHRERRPGPRPERDAGGGAGPARSVTGSRLAGTSGLRAHDRACANTARRYS